MTNREFFETIANFDGITDELKNFAIEGIAKLDKRNATRSSKPSKTQIENAPIVTNIKTLLESMTNPITASEIGVALNISTSKASALAKMVDGIEILEVKSKGRKVNGYRIANAVAPSDDDED